jgi:hypothetical protein
MASGDHAFVKHGEDYELLLMDDVIDDMAGMGKLETFGPTSGLSLPSDGVSESSRST